MPDRTTDTAASEPQVPTPETDVPGEAPEAAAPETPAGAATPTAQMPEYKGEPLDSERGPGLGCFWIQIGLLTFFLIFTPLTVTWGWDPLISGALLIFTLILLLFSGQTVIFLLRLVAADRRTRRTPLNPSAKLTVGQMEDAAKDPPPSEEGSSEKSSTEEDSREDGSSEEKPTDG